MNELERSFEIVEQSDAHGFSMLRFCFNLPKLDNPCANSTRKKKLSAVETMFFFLQNLPALSVGELISPDTLRFTQVISKEVSMN